MKINTFKPAIDQGRLKEGDYFLVKYPDGKEALFRLFKTENGHVMRGPLTAKRVLFRGKEGYDNLFVLADSQAKKEYANDAFEDVHACACSHVSSSGVNTYWLYCSSYDASRNGFVVRPEAIPKPTMKFLEEGCDGSKEKPWICLESNVPKI